MTPGRLCHKGSGKLMINCSSFSAGPSDSAMRRASSGVLRVIIHLRCFNVNVVFARRRIPSVFCITRAMVIRESQIVNDVGTPGRTLACNLRVRSAALYTLSYGSVVEMVRQDGSAPPSPQCRCGDLLVIYWRMVPCLGVAPRPFVP